VVPVPPIFEHVPVPTFMALLGEANQGHDNQNHCDASGYNVLCHGCHSRGPHGQGLDGTPRNSSRQCGAVIQPSSPAPPLPALRQRVHHPVHGRMRAVLDFDPMLEPALVCATLAELTDV
jgi:hypothetical protein